MIDWTNESTVLLQAAGALLPGHPCARTLARWATRGVRGVILDTCVVGNRRFTTRESIERFVRRLTEDQTPAVGR